MPGSRDAPTRRRYGPLRLERFPGPLATRARPDSRVRESHPQKAQGDPSGKPKIRQRQGAVRNADSKDSAASVGFPLASPWLRFRQNEAQRPAAGKGKSPAAGAWARRSGETATRAARTNPRRVGTSDWLITQPGLRVNPHEVLPEVGFLVARTPEPISILECGLHRNQRRPTLANPQTRQGSALDWRFAG